MTLNVIPAYFGSKKKKKKLVKRALEHQNAGRIEQRSYGQWRILQPGTAEFRGCAIGCLTQPIKKSFILDGFNDLDELEIYQKSNPDEPQSIAQDNSDTYEVLREKFNFSSGLCAAIEAIFECLPASDAKNWPYKIVSSIKPGTDVSNHRIGELIRNNDALEFIMNCRFRGKYSMNMFADVEILYEYYTPRFNGHTYGEANDTVYEKVDEAADILVRALSE